METPRRGDVNRAAFMGWPHRKADCHRPNLAHAPIRSQLISQDSAAILLQSPG
jgi:hypothetical protein